MSTTKDALPQAAGDAGVSRDELTERGHYGRALRAGQVLKSSAAEGHRLNTFLQGLNVVLWVLAGIFVLWRLYAVYTAGGA